MMMKAPFTNTSPKITVHKSHLSNLVAVIRKMSKQMEILQKQIPPKRPSCAYQPHFELWMYCSSVRYTLCLPFPWNDWRIWKIIREFAMASASTIVQSSHPTIRSRALIHTRTEVRSTATMLKDTVIHTSTGPMSRSGGLPAMVCCVKRPVTAECPLASLVQYAVEVDLAGAEGVHMKRGWSLPGRQKQGTCLPRGHRGVLSQLSGLPCPPGSPD